ncbi:zinc-dependent metalloprotease [Flavitalea flava]
MQRCLLVLFFLPLVIKAQTLPGIEEKTKGLKAYPGFFNFYWDGRAGKIWMEIDKLDSEVLYQPSLSAGLGSNDVGLDRGILGSAAVVSFNRVGNKVLMIQPNYDFRAVTRDPGEKRAVEQSFARSALWGFVVEAESKGAVLVDATSFLMSDVMQIAARLKTSKQGNYTIDLSRSALYFQGTRNFPLNTELETTMTFVSNDNEPGDFVRSVTPSASSITLRVHHSFVQLPDNKYQPREFDPRSGYYGVSFFDYSTPVYEPIQKQFIARHRLQKKDSSAALGEPVKPIVYYLDNGTPEPIRSALLEGARWWGQAFEAAGFKNAFRVEILPDSADPMDLRYNMINWVHRSTRGWSYGASVVDPRTGEIIKGNVTLGSLRVRQDYLIASGLLAPYVNGQIPTDNPMLKMALDRLKHLAAHEVGHTLGLMHNYIASAQDRASVMDYPHPLLSLDGKGNVDLSNAYTHEIGDWDKVTIAYGYSEFQQGIDEKKALNKIITDAAQKGLTFISDRDARDPGGLHPNAHLWDNGKDPVTGLQELMKIRTKALAQFGENNIRQGTSMAMLEDVLVPVYLMHRYQLEAVTKTVGGQYYSYAVRGDGQLITRSISREEQLRALESVADCMDPAILALPDGIVRLIPPRPAGYEYTPELFNHRTGLGFDPLGAAEAASDLGLSFLFNTDRLNRMAEFQATNNGLGIGEMTDLLVTRTWKAPRLQGLPELIRQQNGQLLLTYLLAASVNDKASFATKAQLMSALDNLKTYIQHKRFEKDGKSDKTDKADKSGGYDKAGKNKSNDEDGNLLLALERMKDPSKARATVHPIVIPPGAPIGCDGE